MDPENLRFCYDIPEETEALPTKSSKKQKPVIYREQVGQYLRGVSSCPGFLSLCYKECIIELEEERYQYIGAGSKFLEFGVWGWVRVKFCGWGFTVFPCGK